jgi:hypothetical protein
MIRKITLTKEFKPFPVYTDRGRWNALPEGIKSFYREEGNKLRGKEWESLPATEYLDFYRNGNRTRYESRYFGRRSDIIKLVLAECIEAKGEYIDDIINGVWLVCEESTWVLPAHNNSIHDKPKKGPDELMDFEERVYIDLFAAETGSLLAWVYYFLGDAIGAQAPLVKRRIEVEVERRILKPFLESNDFGWMGLNHENPVNNWNPWINSNIIVIFLVFAKVFPRAGEGVNKAIQSANRFIYFYADDGGCDEGPGYFNAAGASFYDCIEELGCVTDVSYLYREPKIRNMVSYIYKVYIGKSHYVNYADAPPEVSPPMGLLERAARETGESDLAGFTAYLRENKFCTPDTFASRMGTILYRLLSNIFSAGTTGAAKPAFKLPASVWFEGIEVAAARDSTSNTEGLFFSAKGGHNAESHNHNDVGNFILYCNGEPVVIDAGVEAYTKFTFSDKRYNIWTMRSYFHNTPSINGKEQSAGADYKARDLSFADDGANVRFSLDIAGAYPEDAGVQSWRREFLFSRGKGLTLTDTYSLKACTAAPELNFICRDRPVISGGAATLSGLLKLEFDSGVFSAEIDEIPLEDPKIRHDWNKDALYRLRLLCGNKNTSGNFVLRFNRL